MLKVASSKLHVASCRVQVANWKSYVKSCKLQGRSGLGEESSQDDTKLKKADEIRLLALRRDSSSPKVTAPNWCGLKLVL